MYLFICLLRKKIRTYFSFIFLNPHTGSLHIGSLHIEFRKLDAHNKLLKAGSGRAVDPGASRCWGPRKQASTAGRRLLPGIRNLWTGFPEGRTRILAAQGGVCPAWWAGGRVRAGLQPRLLQPTRRSGEQHDAGRSKRNNDEAFFFN